MWRDGMRWVGSGARTGPVKSFVVPWATAQSHTTGCGAARNRMTRLPRQSSSSGAACDPGPGPGAVMSPSRAIRPLDDAFVADSCAIKGGLDIPEVTKSDLTVPVHAGPGPLPEQQQRALGEGSYRAGSIPFLLAEARSVVQRLSNRTLATRPLPLRMVRAVSGIPRSCATRTAWTRDGSRPYQAASGPRLVDEPAAQLHGGAKTTANSPTLSITPVSCGTSEVRRHSRDSPTVMVCQHSLNCWLNPTR